MYLSLQTKHAHIGSIPEIYFNNSARIIRGQVESASNGKGADGGFLYVRHIPTATYFLKPFTRLIGSNNSRLFFCRVVLIFCFFVCYGYVCLLCLGFFVVFSLCVYVYLYVCMCVCIYKHKITNNNNIYKQITKTYINISNNNNNNNNNNIIINNNNNNDNDNNNNCNNNNNNNNNNNRKNNSNNNKDSDLLTIKLAGVKTDNQGFFNNWVNTDIIGKKYSMILTRRVLTKETNNDNNNNNNNNNFCEAYVWNRKYLFMKPILNITALEKGCGTIAHTNTSTSTNSKSNNDNNNNR